MEFKLSTFLISIVVFSVIVVGLSLPYGDLGTKYNTKVDTSFNKTYEKINIISNSSIDVGEEITGKDISTYDAFFLAGKSILSAARIVFNSFGVVISIVYNIQVDLGIPRLFAAAIESIILIAIVFAIISLWARFRT